MPVLTGGHGATAPDGSRPLAPDRLGKIVVARFLELPLRAFERRVVQLERSPYFRALRPVVRVGSVSELPSAPTGRSRPVHLLGRAELHGDGIAFRYTSAVLAREYLFDEAALAKCLPCGDLALTRLVARLRLVNTRNRLTHALVQALLAAQREYILGGDPLRLRPLTQAALSTQLRLLARSLPVQTGARGACPVDADPSRVSRLMRRLAVCLPRGEVVWLRNLCPRARDLHRLYVGRMLRLERARMVEDSALTPMTDGEIVAAVHREFDARLLPRSVAYIRRDLGIPSSRERGQRSEYLSMTVEFSSVLPLTVEILSDHVPPGPGVYELRSKLAAPGTCPIIYVGSARDLRKRLGDHLRGWSDNALLQAHVQRGVRFRYRPVAARWRDLERAVYRAYCATFGAPPLCNRMSP